MQIQTKLHLEDICSVQSNSYAVLLAEGFGKHEYEHIAKIAGFDVQLYLENKKFTGAAGSIVALPVIHQGKVTELFFVGLGKKENNVLSFENYRRALGSLITNAQAKKLESLVFAMPSAEYFDVTVNYLASQTHAIITIAGYKFDQFVTQGEKAADLQVHVAVGNNSVELAEQGFAVGAVIGQAVNRERDWVNTPPSKLTPTHVADMAQKLAEQHGLTCTIFDGKKIAELGMEGLHGVSRGSGQDPRFVILEYKSKNPNAQTIGFVGKGITFDSGGLSIKPADSMEEMKEDMAGAGAVINAIVALAQLQPNVNVVACAALTENLVGPHSLKPGDILKFYNGKTAEVRNTDAEGRLVLADALSYITKNYQLSAVIDIATLTGACIYAVGPFFAALLSDNQNFAD
ncbi:MAG: leucyl aminopeptidase family protein, partial [Candidatus Chromulinivorax sp.]